LQSKATRAMRFQHKQNTAIEAFGHRSARKSAHHPTPEKLAL
jgi:hypothetical protein